MPRKKRQSSRNTDEKKVFAQQWMKDNPTKVTINGLNEVVKEKFGKGFGKQLVMSLVSGFRGEGSAPAKGKKKRAAGRKPGPKPQLRKTHNGDAVVELSAEVRKAFVTLRNAGIKSVDLSGPAPRIRL